MLEKSIKLLSTTSNSFYSETFYNYVQGGVK